MASAVNGLQMAAAEAYIHGFEVPDALVRATIQATMPTLFRHFPALLAPYDWVLRESNRLADSSGELMKIQYNLPLEMMKRMLGEGPLIYPKYSMGLWENGAGDLEAAQIQMIDQIIERLGIEDGDHVLDLGCGWGCVANYLLSRFPNLRVTGLNLSSEQCGYIRGKMLDPGSLLSSSRFTLVEADLNAMAFASQFDKVLSIGLFEHVGNLTEALHRLASLIKPGGKVFIHLITVRIPNPMSSGFTHRYIFPHGRYWNYEAIPARSRDLRTEAHWFLNGMNYHRTIAAWLQRFDASIAEVKDLDYGMDFATFRRIWRFYLLLLGTIFATGEGRFNGNGQYLLVKA